MVIDARGLGCPKPVMLANEALSKIKEGEIKILVDNESSVKNILRFAEKSGYFSESKQENNHWCVTIVKGFKCELPKTETGENKDFSKELFVIIATDSMGKDEELGKILMKAYLETMLAYKELPNTIFFMNTGIRLTTINENIIPIIKEIENQGVEIFTCGTCLKFFNLESELKVGYRGTTNHIVEGIKEHKKTVWIG
jgi:selenium metabolism protein YedF